MQNIDVYWKLQQRLDKQLTRFPKLNSGADLNLLKFIFNPEQVELAIN